MKRAPPVVRAVNVFAPFEPIADPLSTAHTKEPSSVALALSPATKLNGPPAVLP